MRVGFGRKRQDLECFFRTHSALRNRFNGLVAEFVNSLFLCGGEWRSSFRLDLEADVCVLFADKWGIRLSVEGQWKPVRVGSCYLRFKGMCVCDERNYLWKDGEEKKIISFCSVNLSTQSNLSNSIMKSPSGAVPPVENDIIT